MDTKNSKNEIFFVSVFRELFVNYLAFSAYFQLISVDHLRKEKKYHNDPLLYDL